MPGLRLMGREVVRSSGAAELDPLRLTIDVRGLGISGYQAGDWLRAACHVDIGSADQCHIGGQITHADDDQTEAMLISALQRLTVQHTRIEPRPQAELPPLRSLELETVMLPRDAFFGRVEQVPVDQAVGRTAAEMASPYPPGVPVFAPGEVINQAALDYLTTGVKAGMLIPDAADPTMKTIRVVAA
jgi:arginine decarboxylase